MENKKIEVSKRWKKVPMWTCCEVSTGCEYVIPTSQGAPGCGIDTGKKRGSIEVLFFEQREDSDYSSPKEAWDSFQECWVWVDIS